MPKTGPGGDLLVHVSALMLLLIAGFVVVGLTYFAIVCLTGQGSGGDAEGQAGRNVALAIPQAE